MADCLRQLYHRYDWCEYFQFLHRVQWATLFQWLHQYRLSTVQVGTTEPSNVWRMRRASQDNVTVNKLCGRPPQYAPAPAS